MEGEAPKSECPLCVTYDRETSALILIVLIGTLLLACVCYVWGQKCRLWRRQRGRNNGIVSELEVPRRDDDENDVMSDVSIRLKNTRRSQIVSFSLVTTKAIAAAVRPSVSIDVSEKDSLESSVHTESSSCASLDSSSHTTHGDEEDGLPLALEGSSICTPSDEVDYCLVLESTGWEAETCAICIEQYEENDIISYSKRQSCTHAFHKKCIELWLKDKDDCPCCRCPYV